MFLHSPPLSLQRSSLDHHRFKAARSCTPPSVWRLFTLKSAALVSRHTINLVYIRCHTPSFYYMTCTSASMDNGSTSSTLCACLPFPVRFSNLITLYTARLPYISAPYAIVLSLPFNMDLHLSTRVPVPIFQTQRTGPQWVFAFLLWDGVPVQLAGHMVSSGMGSG